MRTGAPVPLLRPCKNTAAFEAIPDERRKLDLKALQAALAEDGWALVADAGVMLIMRRDIEVSVYYSGKMLLKTLDPEAARAAFKEVHARIEPDATSHEPTMEGLERLEGLKRLDERQAA